MPNTPTADDLRAVIASRLHEGWTCGSRSHRGEGNCERVAKILVGELDPLFDQARAEVVEAVLAEHVKTPRYRLAEGFDGDCNDGTHDHDEDEVGYAICRTCPPEGWCCSVCRDTDGEGVEWPCPTAAIVLRFGGDPS